MLFYWMQAWVKTLLTDICLENIVMLYIRVRSLSYTKDVVTQLKIREKLKLQQRLEKDPQETVRGLQLEDTQCRLAENIESSKC